ncbi:hypothetical protein HDZ31DRAFT_33422 [Schizophyllum fasciatum]
MDAAPEEATPRLPLEVLFHIIDCTSDWKTCLSCSLVSRAFLEQSRRRVCRRARLHRLTHLRDFSALVESPVCTIARHVRWLSFEQHHVWATGGASLDCLRHLPNLATLRIVGMTSAQNAAGLMNISSCITSLTLDCVGFVTLEHFKTMLRALPELRNLTLADIFIREQDSAGPAEPMLTKIHSFRCIAWSAFYMSMLTMMLELPRPPPLAHVDLRVPYIEDRMSSLFCAFLNHFGPTLKALRLDPGYKHFVPSEYGAWDVGRLTALRLFTVIPVVLSDWHDIGAAQSVLDLLLLVLRAPVLRKVVIVLCVSDGRFGNDLTPLNWAILDLHVGRKPQLEQVKFALCGSTSTKMQKIADLIKFLLPKASTKGILHFGMSTSVGTHCEHIPSEPRTLDLY